MKKYKRILTCIAILSIIVYACAPVMTDETIIASVNGIPDEMSFDYPANEQIISGHDNNFNFVSDDSWCVVVGDKIKVESNPTRQSRETSVNVSWKNEMMKAITVKQAGIPTPPNDQCSGAISLSCGANLFGTTVNATAKTLPGNTASKYGVWYTFTGDGRQTTISLTAASGYDPEIVIFRGSSCSNMEFRNYSDNGVAGGIDTYTYTATSGIQYYIYVAYCLPEAGSNYTGSFNISRSCSSNPNPNPNPDPNPSKLSAPINVTANVTGTSVVITWSRVSEATSYEVFYSNGPSSSRSLLGTSTSTTITDKTPYKGPNYYWVKAKNSSSTSEYSSYAHCNVSIFN